MAPDVAGSLVDHLTFGVGATGHDPSVTTSYDHSIDGARAAADADDLDVWVRAFLASDGSDNAELGEHLSSQKSSWYGPVELPFDELHRLAGPPDQPTLERLTSDDIDTVEDMADSIDDGWEPAPFVVSFDDDHLVVEDGNHRIEGLRRSGHRTYWCVVGFDDDTQRATFLDRHGG